MNNSTLENFVGIRVPLMKEREVKLKRNMFEKNEEFGWINNKNMAELRKRNMTN